MKIISKGRNRVVIDGRTFEGKDVTIQNDEVWVDGKKQSDSLIDSVTVTVHGDVDTLDLGAGKAVIRGSCARVETQSGDVECGDVKGSVTTMSGDVHCGKVGGSIKTMSGDVDHR